MNRNIRVHSKRGNSFRVGHWSSIVWVPCFKGNTEETELKQRGQTRRLGVQEASLGRKDE